MSFRTLCAICALTVAIFTGLLWHDLSGKTFLLIGLPLIGLQLLGISIGLSAVFVASRQRAVV